MQENENIYTKFVSLFDNEKYCFESDESLITVTVTSDIVNCINNLSDVDLVTIKTEAFRIGTLCIYVVISYDYINDIFVINILDTPWNSMGPHSKFNRKKFKISPTDLVEKEIISKQTLSYLEFYKNIPDIDQYLFSHKKVQFGHQTVGLKSNIYCKLFLNENSSEHFEGLGRNMRCAFVRAYVLMMRRISVSYPQLDANIYEW